MLWEVFTWNKPGDSKAQKVRNSVPVYRRSFDILASRSLCLIARAARELKLLHPATRIQIRVTQ